MLVLLQLPPPACCWAASLVGDAVAAAAAPRQRGGENPAVVVAKGIGAPLPCAESHARGCLHPPARRSKRGQEVQSRCNVLRATKTSSFARLAASLALPTQQLLERLPFLRCCCCGARHTGLCRALPVRVRPLAMSSKNLKKGKTLMGLEVNDLTEGAGGLQITEEEIDAAFEFFDTDHSVSAQKRMRPHPKSTHSSRTRALRARSYALIFFGASPARRASSMPPGSRTGWAPFTKTFPPRRSNCCWAMATLPRTR